MLNAELKKRIDDAVFEIARKRYKDLGGVGDLGPEREAEVRNIALDYLNWYADEYKDQSDVVGNALEEYDYPSEKDFERDITSNNDLIKKITESVIPFENIDPSSFEDVSNKVSSLTSYGVHQEIPDEDSYMFNWSNGMRGWYVGRNPVKAGESVSVDANQFLYPKSKIGKGDNADVLAMTLPELPLYYGSSEAGERGEISVDEKYKIWLKGHSDVSNDILLNSVVSDIPVESTTMIIPKNIKFKDKILGEYDDIQE